MVFEEEISGEEEVLQRNHPSIPMEFQETYEAANHIMMVRRGEGRTKTRFDDSNLIKLKQEQVRQAVNQPTQKPLLLNQPL